MDNETLSRIIREKLYRKNDDFMSFGKKESFPAQKTIGNVNSKPLVGFSFPETKEVIVEKVSKSPRTKSLLDIAKKSRSRARLGLAGGAAGAGVAGVAALMNLLSGGNEDDEDQF